MGLTEKMPAKRASEGPMVRMYPVLPLFCQHFVSNLHIPSSKSCTPRTSQHIARENFRGLSPPGPRLRIIVEFPAREHSLDPLLIHVCLVRAHYVADREKVVCDCVPERSCRGGNLASGTVAHSVNLSRIFRESGLREFGRGCNP